jgi:hypothetical protein
VHQFCKMGILYGIKYLSTRTTIGIIEKKKCV